MRGHALQSQLTDCKVADHAEKRVVRPDQCWRGHNIAFGYGSAPELQYPGQMQLSEPPCQSSELD